jgi:D-alanine-D-alanine ligase-like ATP-grasp enzyme
MKPCLYCGNNAIPHQTHKIFESFDILVSPIRRTILQTWFGTATDQLAEWVGLGLFHILHSLGLITINREIEKIPYDRAKMLWQEALARQIEIEELKPFNRSIDMYRAKLKNRWHYFMNLPRREKVTTSNLTWIDDKYLLKKKLLQHNFPAARGGSFTNLSSALKTFDALDKPVIVKPRAGSRGRHTTTLVRSKDDFEQAFRIAKQLCHWVVVEEHLFGDVQRATIVGGKLIGVLGGSPPRVTGDSSHTIAELIKVRDSARPEKVKEIKVNPYFLQRQNMTLETILPIGQTIDLLEKIGVNYGGTSYDCTKQTHPETKQMLEAAGKILEISILGFDFIIPDITKSYREQKCGIIECNGAPFIQLHHEPLYGESINVAKHIWDLVS